MITSSPAGGRSRATRSLRPDGATAFDHAGRTHTRRSNGLANAEDGRHPRVLVVGGEPSIIQAVSATLRPAGHEVQEAICARQALRAVRELPPDLIVLDGLLVDADGRETARMLCSEGLHVPFLFVDGGSRVDAREAGLTVGGYDHMAKPFALVEVVTRVHALLHRASPAPARTFRFADIEMDHWTHEVHRAGHPIELTPTEFNLLGFFLLNPRLVLSKSRILDHAWRYDFVGGSKVVDVYVGRLRRKLEVFGPQVIYTIRLAGYMLGDPAPYSVLLPPAGRTEVVGAAE